MHSTMRMGSDASNSVVDPTGETRAVRGLFIADNSALSNALGGPNPTLTTQAIATRTAENIFVRYFGGQCWIRSCGPVCSTDPRVTRACIQRGL
jgi:choline dehydrogenase-like flavoprotein